MIDKARATNKYVNIQERTEAILEMHPSTRNCDTRLILTYWRENHGIHSLALHSHTQLSNTEELTNPGSIIRARRKIQNEKKLYPPTKKHIKEARGIKEEALHEHFATTT